MSTILAVTGTACILVGLVWLMLRNRAAVRRAEIHVEICTTCGTKRTTILEPRPQPNRQSLLLHGVRSRTYTYPDHPPADDGFAICRGSGHEWSKP